MNRIRLHGPTVKEDRQVEAPGEALLLSPRCSALREWCLFETDHIQAAILVHYQQTRADRRVFQPHTVALWA